MNHLYDSQRYRMMKMENPGRHMMLFSGMGLLKKAASGVLAIFPCSRTKRTLRAKKRLRPCWTDFFEPTRSL
jgi:hypothetical protein